MIRLREKFIVDKSGDKTDVVIPYRDYTHLMEDLHDLTMIAERKNEKSISHDKFKKKMQANGLLSDWMEAIGFPWS